MVQKTCSAYVLLQMPALIPGPGPSEHAGSQRDECSAEGLATATREVKAGCKALDDFMEACNRAWAKTLNYAHVGFAGDAIRVWDTPEVCARDNDTGPLTD